RRSVAREWGPANVRVNMVLLGWHAAYLTGCRADPAPAPFGPALGHGTAPDAVASFVVALADLRNVSGHVFNLDSRIPPFSPALLCRQPAASSSPAPTPAS